MPEQVDHLLLTRMWHGRAHGLHTRLPFGLVFEYIGSRDLPFGTHTCNTLLPGVRAITGEGGTQGDLNILH